MVISILNGSPRKQGSTAQLLQHAKLQLEKYPDVMVSYYDLIDFEIKPCTGCRICYLTGSCSIKTDMVEELSRKIKQSDGIIIASSTFGSNVTGLLKSFMDRGHFLVEQALYDKYGLAVATYEIAEGHLAYRQINKFFLVAGATSRRGVLAKLDFAIQPVIPDKYYREMDKRIGAFYRAISKKTGRNLFEFLFTKVILLPLIWKPIFTKRKKEFAGILAAWKAKGLYQE